MGPPCGHNPSKDGCHLCWLYLNDQRYRSLWDGQKRIETRIATPQIARPKMCGKLGDRVEFRAGCGGWNCLHKCRKYDTGDNEVVVWLNEHGPQNGQAGLTIPGSDDGCQKCPGYEL